MNSLKIGIPIDATLDGVLQPLIASKKFREMFISFPDEMYKLTYLRLNLD